MKKRLQPRDVRVSMNPITGALESVVLDDVQRAVEYVHQAIDRAWAKLPVSEYARFAERLQELVAGMKRNTN